MKYKKHKKHPKSPMGHHFNPLSKPSMSSMTGFDRLDSPKSLYNLSDDQTSTSSQTTSLSAPSSPHPDHLPPSINILKAVLTGSQEVSHPHVSGLLPPLLFSYCSPDLTQQNIKVHHHQLRSFSQQLFSRPVQYIQPIYCIVHRYSM